MTRLVFDLETNGLLPGVDKIHSIVLKDPDTGVVCSFSGPGVDQGVHMLTEADEIIGHNVIGYDIPVLAHVLGVDLSHVKVFDTMVAAALVWPTDVRKERDFTANKAGKLPGKLIGRNSLESWGHRFGNYKGDFKGPWDTWTPEMQSYCEQDVEVTCTLLKKLEEAGWSEEAMRLEHEVKRICFRQERYGFGFDEKGAQELYTALAKRRITLEAELQDVFPAWWRKEKEFVPARDNKKMGYVGGAPLTKIKLTDFNPGSRDHIADRLVTLRGWRPKEHGKDGKPTVDETVLSSLPYPEAKVLSDYFTVEKRVGQLAEGKEAWMKAVKRGRIHGRVNTNEAVTGRMTHAGPNIAQVPTVKKLYGKECRGLFIPLMGGPLVGIDAKGLELRCLAGYMHMYDGGEYSKIVIEGDPHQVTADLLGVDRDVTAKRIMYALLYGAGDFKLGLTFFVMHPGDTPKGKKKITAIGREVREKLMAGLPAFGKLIEEVAKRVDARGSLIGLDGRVLPIRSPHAALNTLLQSAGALLMKRALVLFDADVGQAGLIPGVDFEFVANVHDEWQLDTAREDTAHDIGVRGCAAIVRAGETFKFPCPLAGSYKVGTSWAETH
ncbi:MAG: DNA polymerase [Actinobacteria bacterium]|nr:DNA polymerase [Actinomycetota bacterium]